MTGPIESLVQVIRSICDLNDLSNTLHVAKCCPKGQHFPAINDNLYKVQVVISATGS